MPEIVPTRRTVVRTAAWSLPAVSVVAAAPNFAASNHETTTNLSTTVVTTQPSRVSATQVFVPATTFINTGGLPAQGFTVEISTSIPITTLEVSLDGGNSWLNIGALGIIVSGYGTGTISFLTPAAIGTIPAGGTFTSPAPQRFTFQSEGETTMATVVTGVNTAATANIPFVSDTTIPAL